MTKYFADRLRITNGLARSLDYILLSLIFFIPLSKAAVEILFSAAILVYLFLKILKKDFSNFSDRFNFPIYFFLFFMGISVINSGPFLSVSIRAFFGKWLENILLFLMVQDRFSSPQTKKRAVLILLACALLMSADGIYQKIVGFDVFWMRPLVDCGRNIWGITATLQHYNAFGAYIILVFPLVLSLCISKELLRLRLGIGILAFLLLFCLYFTFSRSAWISIVFGLLIMAVLSRHYKKVSLLISLFLLILLIFPQTRARFLFIFSISGDQGRYLMWKSTWRMIMENPFLGKGIGTFMSRFPAYYPKMALFPAKTYAHNSYLQIWAESGLFALLSFLSFILMSFWSGIKRFLHTKDAIQLGLLGGLSAFLAQCFFDNNLYSLQLSALFWIFAGLLDAAIKNSQNL